MALSIRFSRFLPYVLGACLLPAALAHAWQELPSKEYSLSNGTRVTLTTDWGLRDVSRMPPPTLLSNYAPSVAFTDLLLFENAGENAQFQIALTSNPFLGRDASWLDGEMHQDPSSGRGMAAYLFYFFFPPPRGCLSNAIADFQTAVKTAQADTSQPSLPQEISVQHECNFAPSLTDFYAYQVASAIKLARTENVDHLEGVMRDFYQLPMEQVEFSDQTFYIFEAQGQLQLPIEMTSFFDLPDALQGSRADFIWAVGSPSPFPFVHDLARKNIPLIQVAYAGVGLAPDKRPEFMRLLRTIRTPPPRASS